MRPRAARRNSPKLHPGLITRDSLNDMLKLVDREKAEIAYLNRSRSQRKDVQASAKQERELIALRKLVKTVGDDARVLSDQAVSLGWNPSNVVEKFFGARSEPSLFMQRWLVVDMIWTLARNDTEIKDLASIPQSEALSRASLRRSLRMRPDLVEAISWVREPDLANSDRVRSLIYADESWYYNDSEARLRLLHSLEPILPDPASIF